MIRYLWFKWVWWKWFLFQTPFQIKGYRTMTKEEMDKAWDEWDSKEPKE